MNCTSIKCNRRYVHVTVSFLVCLIVLVACSRDSGTCISRNESSEKFGTVSADMSISPCFNTNGAAAETMAEYQSVLLGEKDYHDATSMESLSINQIIDLGNVLSAEPQYFVFQDLDGDALPETIVLMDMGSIRNFGSLILRCDGTEVTGYFLWPRAFGDLKMDGTFSSSSGAFDHGYSRIDFSAFDDTADAPNNTIIHPVCYCTSSAGYDENGELIEKYYNDGVEITAEEFEREQERQFAKENVQWMEFTSDNVTSSIAQFQNSSNW